ncbi:type VI secretion system contractile sheath small subunit [Corallococcus terminator]|uniref:Type VI secretion system contractile sheath small subunit n=1 Tax=Corallococcus terminator TaxID=2316733 RepID=A0A3A8J4R5_9BACT|nr:type VI secretion system contractile sheath small subunit [Corallococcus terminator]RKG84543.1 type VI secretion system contractile sheath small subunit [Corallococcus terminator]
MSKENSVAPTERVNIVYKPATGNAQEQVELPLKTLVMGDFTGREDDRPLEQRAPINVDKSNFNEVMAQQDLRVTLTAADKLSNEAGASLSVNLQFKNLSDFAPESVVNQVPELKKLLELRNALNALKGPLGNLPAFRKKLQSMLNDEEGRKKLIEELGLKPEDIAAASAPTK